MIATWQALCAGPAAADLVHMSEVVRRLPAAGVCRAPVPVRRRRVVRRRYALPRVETAPETEHRSRHPGLGGLGEPLRGLLVILSRAMRLSQRKHSIRVPLPRRLLQKRHALLCPGLAPANIKSFDGQVTIDTSRAGELPFGAYVCQPYLNLWRSAGRAGKARPIRARYFPY